MTKTCDRFLLCCTFYGVTNLLLSDVLFQAANAPKPVI